jgi:thiol-disulfide isomerase/thioredoxin
MKSMMVCLLMVVSVTVFAQQKGKVVKLDQLQDLVKHGNDQINVINFWATWCAPCVKELPLFEALGTSHPEVHVTLVSMDLDLDPNPEKVNRYIERHDIHSEVWMLDAPDANSWINKIDKVWSGALPATLIINAKTGRRKFVEGELQEDQLEKLITDISSSS